MTVMDRSPAMSGPIDDLPRTLRREREARERAQSQGLPPAGAAAPSSYVPEPLAHEAVVMSGTTVTDIRIPFFRLVVLAFKLMLASLPAIAVLGVILWLAGHALMTFFPWLVKVQLLIKVP